ncbi:tyrosine-protein kinase [Mangrovimonas sp. YM274]|uniref:GumC family protein n=1 Tax=Mangrovimonas sp. YM274 TaxID=3070660 RepID=UPI0027DC3CF7|nr:tyrosine-protein kinase [Mangrovimonas sp. YM274]WMI67257.1 polysaccharide biosynthesis tyrosine autokinase [Mangrovimonas sp. YM274]
MENQNVNTKELVNSVVGTYLSRWKLIVACLIVAFIIAFLKVRYTAPMYQATASLKIKEDKNSNKLAEISTLQNYGMFSNNFSNVNDEIEIIKSRTIIAAVVKDLKLNIKQYVSGKILDGEAYTAPPFTINFLESDSIIDKVGKSLFIKVLSPQQFELSYTDNYKLFKLGDDPSEIHNFGDKVSWDYGEFILTPNIGVYGTAVDSYVEIRITPLDNVIEGYLGKIKIESSKESNVIKVSVTEEIPEKSVVVLNKLIEKYNQDVINDKEQIIEATSAFITNRLDMVSRELEEVDFTAESLQKSNKLTALTSQANIYLQSEKETESRIIETSNQLELIDYMQDHLDDHSSNSDLLPADIGISDNSVGQITKSHNELVLQRNRILKNSSEKNPTVINLNNQISALKENLKQSLQNIENTNKITLNNLNNEEARINAQIYSAPTKERQFRDIKRQQDIKESLYLYLLQKREETAITLGMSAPNAKVIDQAYSQSTPVSPKKKIIYLAAFLLGLAVPIGFIYVKDLLDNKVHDKDDVQRILSAPYIGHIPKSIRSKNKLIKKIDYSPKAEAFRILRTNINFLLKTKKEKGKTIFVTSTTSQEGKSHTCVNLASSISFSGQKCLIVETDIRVPKVDDYLNIKTHKGLTDFISDPELKINDITVAMKGNDNLFVIPSGTIPPNPAELLMSERVGNLFNEVKKIYDYIIVDTAAVGLVTDTHLISQYADMFLYVVSVNNVDKRQLHIAQTLYKEGRLPNMAVILNGTLSKNGYGYSYGYGYGKNPNKKKWYNFLKKLS